MNTVTQAIEVSIAPAAGFIKALTGALESFGRLTGAERAALPGDAQAGLSALQQACEEYAGGGALEARSDEERPACYDGRVIIEWPEPYPGGAAGLQGWRVLISDAETGECINSASKVRITADCSTWVVAELTQLLGMDGQPLRDEPADPVTGKIPPCVLNIGDDGKPKEGVFRYLVAGMRVRS